MFSPHRARIVGTRHMAAAGHYLAAQAAFQILEGGGNAVDAGVAGAITLGVVQSEYVSFAGVAPLMIRMAETGRTVTISGLGPWPKATDIEVFHREHGGVIPPGILQTVVPAAPEALILALKTFGTMSFGDVASAAIRYARDGFPAPRLMCDIIRDLEKDYRRWDENARIYLPGGRVPEPGDIFVQEDLGRVLQHMVDEERAAAPRGRIAGLDAAHAAFYRGDIAAAMVKFHAENGGWLAASDLAEFASEMAEPLVARFGAAEILSCGPWCQGPILAQTLNLLDGVDLRALGHNAPAYIHYVAEALKLAYADRHALYGDPNFVEVPTGDLMSLGYAARRRAEIDPARAAPGMPEPGLPSLWDAAGVPAPSAAERPATKLDTSYICVVDRYGNAFSGTPSDGSAESPIVPGLGFAPSSRGTQSWVDRRAPARLGPGRRPRLTPSPSMALDPQGGWLMPFGSPGNDVQPQAMLQVFLNMRVWGMAPQDAIDAPRFATFSYPRSSAPHPYNPGLLNVEGRIPTATSDALRALGHKTAAWPDWTFLAGGVCAILADRRKGTMEGGSDPRRPTGIAGL